MQSLRGGVDLVLPLNFTATSDWIVSARWGLGGGSGAVQDGSSIPASLGLLSRGLFGLGDFPGRIGFDGVTSYYSSSYILSVVVE